MINVTLKTLTTEVKKREEKFIDIQAEGDYYRSRPIKWR